MNPKVKQFRLVLVSQSHCNIQIIVNDNRPYQDTIPVAPGDYSEWTFVVNPQYAEIEEGINTITSKASCDVPHEPFLKLDPLTRQYVKHYGINVTGVPAGVQGGLDLEQPPVFPPTEDEDEDSTSYLDRIRCTTTLHNPVAI